MQIFARWVTIALLGPQLLYSAPRVRSTTGLVLKQKPIVFYVHQDFTVILLVSLMLAGCALKGRFDANGISLLT